MTIYIYGLLCPVAQTIRYVGKTVEPASRLLGHIAAAKKGDKDHYTARWIRRLLAEGLRPSMEILEELPDGSEWEEFERFYIANGADFGWRLTNTTPGGEGGGYVRPEDKDAWRAKVKAALQSPEARAKISAGVKAYCAKPETKKRQSERAKKRWMDPEYKAHMRERLEIVMADPARKKARSELGRAMMTPQIERDRVSKKLKEFYASEVGKKSKIETSNRPEKVLANSMSQAKNWECAEYRTMIMAAKKSPEVVAIQRAKQKALWADPEYRAMRAENLAKKKREKAAALANQAQPI